MTSPKPLFHDCSIVFDDERAGWIDEPPHHHAPPMTTTAPEIVNAAEATVFTTYGHLPASAVRLVRQTFTDAHGHTVVRTDKFLEMGGEHIGNDIAMTLNPNQPSA